MSILNSFHFFIFHPFFVYFTFFNQKKCKLFSSYLYKHLPTTNSLRHRVTLKLDNLSILSSFKKYSYGYQKSVGRNSLGRITVRFRGGRKHRSLQRVITRVYSDFRHIPFRVCSIEHVSGLNHFISLLFYINGFFMYVPTLHIFENHLHSYFFPQKGGFSVFEGGSYPLFFLLIGSFISNLELYPLSGSVFCRSAGTFGVLVQRNDLDCWVRFHTGVVRVFSYACSCIFGQMGSLLRKYMSYGSAGRLRLVGKRPHVRGVAMNPIDHPHGGGEGKSSGGRPSVSPWSFYTKGKKTRSVRKVNNYIVLIENSKKKKKKR